MSDVEQALAGWREARAERDRVLLDGRYSDANRRAADHAARLAEEAYDRAREATYVIRSVT